MVEHRKGCLPWSLRRTLVRVQSPTPLWKMLVLPTGTVLVVLVLWLYVMLLLPPLPPR